MAVALVKAQEMPPPVAAPPRAGMGRLRKVAFIGSHAASLAHAPWDDPTWELWAHASARAQYQRQPDRYFDLHRRECWQKSNNKGIAYTRWLERNTIPIYMQQRFPDVPASVPYPLARIRAEFRPYFTNHVAYMIALALVEGVTHMGFYGVNYGFNLEKGKSTNNADMEYGTQRGSCEYWMGQAEGRGVHLVIPEGSTLLQDPKELYGYESHDAEGKLVPAYCRRTWMRPEYVAQLPTGPIMANGLEAPPPEIAAQMAQEAKDRPRPAGILGPLPEDEFSMVFA
jgi:hypothetical protein